MLQAATIYYDGLLSRSYPFVSCHWAAMGLAGSMTVAWPLPRHLLRDGINILPTTITALFFIYETTLQCLFVFVAPSRGRGTKFVSR